MHEHWRAWLIALSLGFAGAGCGDNINISTGDSGPGGDGGTTPADSSPPDAVEPPAVTRHLLLTEVCLADNASEFIEFYNPTTETVDLTNYYLSDDGNYILLPGEFGAGPKPRPFEETTDFILKFPDGARIGPGEVQVVAVRHDAFVTEFGKEPTYSILDNPRPGSAMVDPGIDRSLVDSNAALHNEGEPITLFYWDGMSDLVQDVDFVQVGQPLTYNKGAKKHTVIVDGPDPDTQTSGYKTEDDRHLRVVMYAFAQDMQSHKRIRLESSRFEKQDGSGNSITGDDETSEDFRGTWDDLGDFTAPTPGLVPQNLRPR